jgi:hypothetical protein
MIEEINGTKDVGELRQAGIWVHFDIETIND